MPSYKLTYFDGRGRAEISRLIFAAAGVEYTDERVKNWPTGKEDAPLGQLPYLTVDNVKIPQSISIARFLAKRFNLAGADDITQAKADVIVDTVLDLAQAFYNKVFFVPAEQKEEALKKFLSEDAPKHLANVDKLIGMYGSNGHSVGSSLSWADLYMFDVVSIVHDKDSKILDNFKNISKVKTTVEGNPNIAAYLKKRPATSF